MSVSVSVIDKKQAMLFKESRIFNNAFFNTKTEYSDNIRNSVTERRKKKYEDKIEKLLKEKDDLSKSLKKEQDDRAGYTDQDILQGIATMKISGPDVGKEAAITVVSPKRVTVRGAIAL